MSPPFASPHLPARPSARRALFVLLLPLLAACGGSGDGGSPDTGSAGQAGAAGQSGAAGQAGQAGASPAVGTVETFLEPEFPSEGIAVAKDAMGRPALYLGGKGSIWTVASDAQVVKVADVPSPLGMARTAQGDVLVCGKLAGDAGKGDLPGAVWRVSPGGQASVLSGGGEAKYALPNMIAVAPDDAIVFSDSKGNKVYRLAPDGSASQVITDQITYPNGVAFSPDGATLYVASYDSKRIFSLARSADGSFAAPQVFADDVENVDGISPLASGDLLLVTTGKGVVRLNKDGSKSTLAATSNFSVPSNGAFGEGDLGSSWLYVSSLIDKRVQRVFVGEPGLTLPVR